MYNFIMLLILFFIICFALIILNCEILSLFQAFNCKNIVIISFIEIIISSFILFKYFKKAINFKKTEAINKIINVFKLDKSLFVFAIFFGLMVLIMGFFAYYFLPLESDARMYHFSRIFEYIHQQSFLHFDTNEARNIIMPINSEMIYSYFYVLKKNEFGFGLLSYFSFIVLLFGLYGIFRELKISIRKTLFSIFLFSSFGMVLVQIPSLQTDLLIACFSILSLYLFIKNKIYFASLSYALALGIKTTAIINFASLFVIILSYTIIFKKDIKNIFKYLVYLFLNFIIFSSYNYILNFIHYGNFLSNKALIAEHYLNLELNSILNNFKNIIKDLFFIKAGIAFDERKVGLSLLGILVFIPSFIFSFLKTKNKKQIFIRICFFSCILNFLIVVLSFEYSEYIIRYFVGFFVFSVFSFSCLYKYKKLKNIIIFISIINLILFTYLTYKYSINISFKQNLFNYEKIKKEIIYKNKKNIFPHIQYEFLEEFKKDFKKEDKVAILNHDNFYEIKQLKNFGYLIDTITLNKILKKEINNYDYLLLAYWGQTNNNLNSLEDFKKDNKNLTCKKYAKDCGKKVFPSFEDCHFKGELLKEQGFKLYKIYEKHDKKMIIYKK